MPGTYQTDSLPSYRGRVQTLVFKQKTVIDAPTYCIISKKIKSKNLMSNPNPNSQRPTKTNYCHSSRIAISHIRVGVSDLVTSPKPGSLCILQYSPFGNGYRTFTEVSHLQSGPLCILFTTIDRFQLVLEISDHHCFQTLSFLVRAG